MILVAEIAAGVWCYTNHSDLEANVRQALKNTVQEEYSVIESRTLAFDTFQSKVIILFFLLEFIVWLVKQFSTIDNYQKIVCFFYYNMLDF